MTLVDELGIGRGTFGAWGGRPDVTGEGVDVREFSVPPVVTISPTANLTDPVFDNAEQHPGTVQFARRDRQGSPWRDVTCTEFRDEVVAVARG
jgi:long-chain acyl-CoA synthetase